MNRLGTQKSAYLQQHAQNPVHWWPYTQQAIEKAREENKPIFLSIGYSSCHWCHVMAEESFQDQETADFLNENFISIKVDKEEFPDIDQYYQSACQMFIQSGGWPLSAFLLPDMRPFFVGTYFPKEPREKLNSFMEVLTELKRAYHEDHDKIEENASKVTESLAQGFQNDQKVEFQGHFPAPSAVLEAVDQFADKDNGGYGQAPKFPQFAFYEWACEQMLEGMVEKKFGEHIILTLENMFTGGIFDQARGGIHRYSTDDKWLIPHFEKMLYDQAGALRVLSKLSLLYPSPLFYDHLFNTLNYLNKEMVADQNFLFSSQDADSEGVEGLYFTFTEQEFEDLINKTSSSELDLDLSDKKEQIKKWFGITPSGNFERGLNVVSLNLEQKEEIFTEQGWKIVRAIREQLLEERKKRIPPATDNKGVASWNFMMISSLVDVMQYCRIDGIRKKASELFNKVMEGSYKTFVNHRTVEQEKKEQKQSTLRHSTTLEYSLPYLEDYVFFAESQLRVYEITGNPTFKENFQETIKLIDKEFFDKNSRPLTRASSAAQQVFHPNQEATFFDSSFRSAAATLVSIVRRGKLLLKNSNLAPNVDKFREEFIHAVLKNPIASGEGLRSLSYPDKAYRVIEVPKSWLSNEQFLNFMPYFLPRFVLDYHEKDEQTWQICSLTECELSGQGVESFIQTLTPKKENKNE